MSTRCSVIRTQRRLSVIVRVPRCYPAVTVVSGAVQTAKAPRSPRHQRRTSNQQNRSRLFLAPTMDLARPNVEAICFAVTLVTTSATLTTNVRPASNNVLLPVLTGLVISPVTLLVQPAVKTVPGRASTRGAAGCRAGFLVIVCPVTRDVIKHWSVDTSVHPCVARPVLPQNSASNARILPR